MLLAREVLTVLILDAAGIDEALDRIASRIAAEAPADAAVGVVGIRRRGEVLAERLIGKLRQRGLGSIAHGALDITLYRDDLAEIGPAPVVRKTEIDFDINGMYLVLVDDVIYTGRSVRAALDALADLGRPRAVRLAVLVDRPGRELPIQADFVGVRTERRDGRVNVLLHEFDGQERVEVE